MTRSRTTPSALCLLLVLAGCGGEDEPAAAPPSPTSASPSPPPTAAPAATPAVSTDVDPCTLLTDAEVLTLTGGSELAGPSNAVELGGISQCQWAPLLDGQSVITVTVDHLPRAPDNISSFLEDQPAEAGLAEHVRERTEDDSEYLVVLTGAHYLSVSIGDNAQLVADRPALARTLLKRAIARLP